MTEHRQFSFWMYDSAEKSEDFTAECAENAKMKEI